MAAPAGYSLVPRIVPKNKKGIFQNSIDFNETVCYNTDKGDRSGQGRGGNRKEERKARKSKLKRREKERSKC